MDWRQWLFDQLTAALVTPEIVDAVYAAGAVPANPSARPFIVIALGEETSDLQDGFQTAASSQASTLWIHDNPGSYGRIDRILKLVRSVIAGQVSEEGAIACVWQGDSGELSDDVYNTIVRTGSYRLVGTGGE